MADRRRPSRNLLLILGHRSDISDWQAGRAFLDPLFADPVLAPARVSLDEKPRNSSSAYVGAPEDCRPFWGHIAQISVQGRTFDTVWDFHWQSRKPATAKGWVDFSYKNLRGEPTPGCIAIEARASARVDWHALLVAWCTAFQPDAGLLHSCPFDDAYGLGVNVLDCTLEEEVQALAWARYRGAELYTRFRAGPLNSMVEGPTNLGWATWFGPGLAHHVDAPALQAAGFPVDRIGEGWLVRLSERVGDVAGDHARFAGLRAQARALFAPDLFLLPPDAGTGSG